MWCLSLLVGAITGILSGMGIGGGTLLVLYLTAVTDIDPTAAAGINLLYFLGCAPPSLFFHARGNLIDKRTALFCILGGSIAAILASLLVPQPTPDWLKRLFGILLLAVGAKELFTVFHGEKKSG